LFAGESDEFAAWISEKTQSLVHTCDRATRDADLETVVSLIKAKSRRTLPFDAPDESSGDKQATLDDMLPFPAEDWTQP
jgi:hypothetical protein